jgi:hypothetical protein
MAIGRPRTGRNRLPGGRGARRPLTVNRIGLHVRPLTPSQAVPIFGGDSGAQVRPHRLGRATPISETRNYVERVLENLQVYRVRFGGGSKLLIEADLRRGASN